MKKIITKNKKRISWLIVLMCISLLGVSGIQAYWMSSAYSIKEQQFDSAVADALADVSNRLAILESMSMFAGSMNLEPLFTGRQNQVSISRTLSDSSFSLDDSVINRKGMQLSFSINGDTLFNLKSFPHPTQTDTGFGVSPSGNYLGVVQKARLMDSVFKQMVLQNLKRGYGLQNRLLNDHLDSLIAFELKARGIHLGYEYMVKNNETVTHTNTETDLKSEVYKAALFQENVISPSLLVITFPSKTRYLLGNMKLTLIISLLFTLAIVFTFYKTLSYSLQQKRVNEIKTDFINNMTHEFKTPIATINLAIDALNNPKVISAPERIKHYSQVIKQENARMNMQVESVLRMALMEKRELELNFTEVDVHKLLNECIDHVSLSLSNAGGQLQKFYNDGGVTLLADENHLANTIINLLDNAIKYASGAPQIRVVTELTGDQLIIIVADKGIGMNKEEQQRIFDRFYRVTGGNVHNIKGHGLGLSYAHGIVEAHNGKITVESEKGVGSKFYVYLPINRNQQNKM